MIVSLGDQGTEDIYHNRNSKKARNTCPRDIWRVAQRKLDYLKDAEVLEDLQLPPGNHLKSRKGNRQGQHSIRINAQYRICFVWTHKGPAKVEIDDYHD